MHAVWELLLDDDFMKAYQEGLIITCGDGVTRKYFLVCSHILLITLKSKLR